MNVLETNLFPITNLAELSANYRIYRLKGLYPDQTDYHRRVQRLRQKLNRDLNTSIGVIARNNEAFLALRENAGEPPAQVVSGGTVVIQPTAEVLRVDFQARTAETEPLAFLFLQDLVKQRLRRDQRLWMPDSRPVFFEKRHAFTGRQIGIHQGFGVRVVPTDDGGIAYCLDIQTKYVSRQPLPADLDRRSFNRFKMRRVVYHYGHQWYEIQLTDCPGLTLAEASCGEAEGKKSLLNWILDSCPKPHPPELQRLPADSAVVEYQQQNDKRAAAAALCYEIFDTTEPEVQREHGRSILDTEFRAGADAELGRIYLTNLAQGGVTVRVRTNPVSCPLQRFEPPELKYGHGRLLSARRSPTPGATTVTLEQLGEARLGLLSDRSAGFYASEPLYHQHFLMPRSVADSWGREFLASLCKAVDRLFPQAKGYNPDLIIYDDRQGRDFVEQGKALLAAIDQRNPKQGFVVAMINESPAQLARNGEDMLEGYVRRHLAERGMVSSVIHSTTGSNAYTISHDRGTPRCTVRPGARGVLSGYVQNVALCHILLPNGRWPYVLGTPLHADVIVGIDVKGNTAGFVAVARDGGTIKLMPTKPSSQKEKLLAGQCRDYVAECVRAVASSAAIVPRSVVIHRDGRIFDTEVQGCQEALALLRQEGVVADDAALTLLEIPKHSLAPFRLFQQVKETDGRMWRDNPVIGAYYLAGQSDAYVCTTGYPFLRKGTAQPLHIHRHSGPLAIAQCAEDVFALACLAWTQPKESSRHPMTLKLNDRQLAEEAGSFDQDVFSFGAKTNPTTT